MFAMDKNVRMGWVRIIYIMISAYWSCSPRILSCQLMKMRTRKVMIQRVSIDARTMQLKDALCSEQAFFMIWGVKSPLSMVPPIFRLQDPLPQVKMMMMMME